MSTAVTWLRPVRNERTHYGKNHNQQKNAQVERTTTNTFWLLSESQISPLVVEFTVLRQKQERALEHRYYPENRRID